MAKPTTRDIAANIVASIQSKLGQNVPFAAKAFVRVIAKAVAGAVATLWTYGDWITLQLSPFTASFDETTILGRTIRPLVYIGRLYGAGDPQPATAATIRVTVYVTNLPDKTIPAGTTFVAQSNGVTYAIKEDTTTVSGLAVAQAVAVSDQAGTFGLGTVGNLTDPTGTDLPLINPVAGFFNYVKFLDVAVPGELAETEDSYRQRVIDRKQRQPQGGAPADYRAWAVDVPGVAQAWPYRADLPGYVDLYIKSTAGDGVPSEELLVAVDEYLNDPTRRPISAPTWVRPVSIRTFDVEVQGLNVADVVSVQSQIEAALTDYFAEREPKVTALFVPPQRDRVSDVSATSVVETVVTAAGGFLERVTLDLDGNDVGFYTMNPGELAKLGTITYV